MLAVTRENAIEQTGIDETKNNRAPVDKVCPTKIRWVKATKALPLASTSTSTDETAT